MKGVVILPYYGWVLLIYFCKFVNRHKVCTKSIIMGWESGGGRRKVSSPELDIYYSLSFDFFVFNSCSYFKPNEYFFSVL